MTFIEFKDVSKSFGPNKVLKGVNLTIEKGETITVLGGSGSGKTVLLKILIKLLQVDRGQVLFEGQDVMKMDQEELLKVRRRVGMLFQGGALFDSLSVKENIAYPVREFFQKTEEEITKIVQEKLELVGLEEIEEKYPSDLSGGMKKRVALARAIAANPEVLLYDEPTTGLDPVNLRRIDHLILNIQKKLDVTSIVVTHNIESAMQVSNRLAFLNEGKIEFVGTKEEILKSKNAVIQDFLKGEI